MPDNIPMTASQDEYGPGKQPGLLRLRVHLGAFRSAPRNYLAACWWRLLGKRLRSRIRLAPLLGLSPHAYDLWRVQNAAPSCDACRVENEGAALLALLAAGGDEGALQQTLSFLAEAEVDTVTVRSGNDIASQLAAAGHKPDAPIWLMPLAAGDTLAPHAAEKYRRAIARAKAEGQRIIYADDDLTTQSGRRVKPHFKPDWNAELFRFHDYLTGSAALRVVPSDLADLPAQDWECMIVRRVATDSDAAPPLHLHDMLHHRIARPAPQPVHPLAIEREKLPKLSVIVPTRNRVDLLRVCLNGLARTDYPDFEVIVVDNGSDHARTLDYLAALDPVRHKVLRAPGPFNFSSLNNRAAEIATGELLCLLNNDIEVLNTDWLSVLATQALRPDVGAAGARLLYPDGRIQHAGVVLGVGGGAAHAHRLMNPEEEGYFHRHRLPQFVSAVTAACLVVRRDRFMAVGGLDEENFAVAFNDVDLCMKLNEQGWQALYEPRATLVHHESVSRGLDRDRMGAARLAGELDALKTRWGIGGPDAVDRFHHPCLSPFSERFVVRL